MVFSTEPANPGQTLVGADTQNPISDTARRIQDVIIRDVNTKLRDRRGIMASEGAADNNNDDDVSPLATADGNISGGPVASTGENQNNTSSQSNNVDDDNRPKKIDKITALQESIDR